MHPALPQYQFPEYFRQIVAGEERLYFEDFIGNFCDTYPSCSESGVIFRAGDREVDIRSMRYGPQNTRGVMVPEIVQIFEFAPNTRNHMRHFIHALNAIFPIPCRVRKVEVSGLTGNNYRCSVNGCHRMVMTDEVIDVNILPLVDEEILNAFAFDFFPVDVATASNAFCQQITMEYDALRATSPEVWMDCKFVHHERGVLQFYKKIEPKITPEMLQDKKFRKARLDLHLFDQKAHTTQSLPESVWSHICSFLGTKSRTPEVLHGRYPLPPSLRPDYQTQASMQKARHQLQPVATGGAGGPEPMGHFGTQASSACSADNYTCMPTLHATSSPQSVAYKTPNAEVTKKRKREEDEDEDEDEEDDKSKDKDTERRKPKPSAGGKKIVRKERHEKETKSSVRKLKSRKTGGGRQ